jgi:hypothetical protein
MRGLTPRSPGPRGERKVLANIVDDWQAQAIAEHQRLVASDRPREALHVAAHALERLHRDLGAPPAVFGWLDLLEADLAATTRDAADVEAAIFHAGLAVLGRCPRHPALPLWHARALAALTRGRFAPDDALAAAHFAFEYAIRAGNFPQARDIVSLARASLAEADAKVRRQWLEAEALEAWLSSDFARARAAVHESLVTGGGYAAWEQGASAALAAGDLALAARCLSAMTRTIDVRRTQDVAHMQFLEAVHARLDGDDLDAQNHLAACLAQDRGSIPDFFTTLWQLGDAHLAVARGFTRSAAPMLAVVLARAGTHYWSFLRFSALLSRTWLRIRQHRATEAFDDLGQALALARHGGYRTCDPWWDPRAMDEIARFAATGRHDAATLQRLVSREA